MHAKNILLFLQSNFPILFIALIASLLFFFFKKWISKISDIAETFLENNHKGRIIIFTLLIFFLCWCYLFKPSYNFFFNRGTAGDNYYYLDLALNKGKPICSNHFSYPFLAFSVIRLLEAFNIINKNDPFYLEKAAALASLPTRIISFIGVIYVFFIFRYWGVTFLESIMASFFLSVSFWYWLWAIQPNAMGIALGIEPIAVYYAMRAINENSLKLIALSAIFISLLVFANISAFYLALGLATVVLWHFFHSRRINFSPIKLLTFMSIIMIMVLIFYFLARKGIEIHPSFKPEFKNTYNPFTIFYVTAAVDYCGNFSITSWRYLLKSFLDNIASVALSFTGILKAKNIIEQIEIISILASYFVLVAVIAKIVVGYREMKYKIPIFLLSFVSFLMFAGFLLRNTGTYYYAVNSVPNLLLFLFILFSIKKFPYKKIALIILTISLFLFNGFSSQKVLQFLKPSDYPVYKEMLLLHKLSRGRVVYYINYARYKDWVIFNYPVNWHWELRNYLNYYNPKYKVNFVDISHYKDIIIPIKGILDKTKDNRENFVILIDNKAKTLLEKDTRFAKLRYSIIYRGKDNFCIYKVENLI